MRLTRQHELFRETIRVVLDRECGSQTLTEWERQGRMPVRELYRALAGEGLLGLTLPEEDGGLGLDLGYSRIWAEELGRLTSGSPVMSLSAHTDIVLPVLVEAGSTAVRRTFVRSAVRGESVGALAVTEPGGGSDLGALRTTAEPVGDHLRLNGSKAYITNGSVAGFALVLCHIRPPGAPAGLDTLSLLVVPTDLPGVTRHRHTVKLGHHACDHGSLEFTDVLVPREFLLGAPGSGYALQTGVFARERAFLAAAMVASARHALEEAAGHARERVVLGRPLLDHQSAGFRLAELDAELSLLDPYVGHVFDLLAEGAPALRQSSVAKLRAARLLREVADLGLQLHGAAGYLDGGAVERRYRDARAFSLAGGAEEALLHLLVGHLPTGTRP
ncbi:acyl-CoA dehydrogenase family protein [Streptomyces roseolilacinus]|uniref:acyl-CoA dehydrogenase family protein n=1 Tax=Streptomyces roseolilacinus TaxID=66904 RepID=UPI003800E557